MEGIFLQANAIQQVGSKFAGKIFSSILWVGLGLILASILGYTMWYFLFYKKKFDINVKIISERAEDKNKTIFDNAAILTDRQNGSKYFKLWSLGKEMPAPRFNVLQNTNKGDYLELYRAADNVFYYLNPSAIDKTEVIRSDGKKYAMAEQKQKLINPDMEFWAVKRKSQNKSMFDTEKLYMKILPYIPHIMGGIIMIFILYLLMSYLPQILSQMQELAKTLNRQQAAEVTRSGLSWALKI